MTVDPVVSVIVLNWNGARILRKCVQSLFKSDYKNLEVVLFDNRSTDGSALEIKRLYPLTKVIMSRSNLGFSKGNNIATAAARGDILIFCNNDVIVEEDSIRKLVEVFANPSIGVASGVLGYPGTSTIYSSGLTVHRSGYIIDDGPPGEPLSKSSSIAYPDAIEGAFLAVSAQLFKVLGMFDENLGAFFEDVDLCFRVRAAGFKVAVRLDCIIWHERSASRKRSFRLELGKAIKNQLGRMYILLKYGGMRGLLKGQIYEGEFLVQSLIRIVAGRAETQVTNSAFRDSGTNLSVRTTLAHEAAMILFGRLIAYFLTPKVIRKYYSIRGSHRRFTRFFRLT